MEIFRIIKTIQNSKKVNSLFEQSPYSAPLPKLIVAKTQLSPVEIQEVYICEKKIFITTIQEKSKQPALHSEQKISFFFLPNNCDQHCSTIDSMEINLVKNLNHRKIESTCFPFKSSYNEESTGVALLHSKRSRRSSETRKVISILRKTTFDFTKVASGTRWHHNFKESSSSPKIVTFDNVLFVIYYFKDCEDRKGYWVENRCHFQRHCNRIKEIISFIFQDSHRDKIQKLIHKWEKNSIEDDLQFHKPNNLLQL
jgi:hypothetical protein